MKKLFCCPALELFHCLPHRGLKLDLPLWKTVLFVSSRAFLSSTPTFLFSTPMENSEATWKKATKCNKNVLLVLQCIKQKLLTLFLCFKKRDSDCYIRKKYPSTRVRVGWN